MKNVRFINTAIFTVVLTLLLISGSFAQDKKDDACCKSSDKKTEKMEHSDKDCPGMNKSIEKLGDNQSTNPEAKQVDSKLVAWNAVCPVRGEEIDPDANKVEYNGKVYGFCCNGCDTKFMKDPVKYSKNISEDGKTFSGTK